MFGGKRKSVSKKRKSMSKRRASTSKIPAKFNSIGKVKAWCFPCRAHKALDNNIKVITRKLPNGNTSYILCGYCKGCTSKVCTVIANSDAKKRK